MQHALMRTWKLASGPIAPTEGVLVIRLEDHYLRAGGIAEDSFKARGTRMADTIKGDTAKAEVARRLFLLLSDFHPDGKITRRRPLVSEVQEVTGADISAIEAIVRLFQSDDRNFLLPQLGPQKQNLAPHRSTRPLA